MKRPSMACQSCKSATAETGSAGVPALGQRPRSVRTVILLHDGEIVEICHLGRQATAMKMGQRGENWVARFLRTCRHQPYINVSGERPILYHILFTRKAVTENHRWMTV